MTPITKTNGTCKLILGLSVLMVIVVTSTYFDLQRRQRSVVTLVEIQHSIDAQTKEIKELEDNGTNTSRKILKDVRKMRKEGTRPVRIMREELGELRKVVDANAAKLSKLTGEER